MVFRKFNSFTLLAQYRSGVASIAAVYNPLCYQNYISSAALFDAKRVVALFIFDPLLSFRGFLVYLAHFLLGLVCEKTFV